MKKVLVAYYSKSGNTRKMAEMIVEGLKQKGVEAILKNVEEIDIDTLSEYDGYIVGSPNYFGTMAYPVKKFFDDSVKFFKKLEGKVASAFCSTGMIGGGGETVCLDILKAFLIHGCIVVGYCSLGHYGPVSIGTPDDRVKKEISTFVDKFAQIISKL
jgi:NAD(P)H dehydrogenase (quinone)